MKLVNTLYNLEFDLMENQILVLSIDEDTDCSVRKQIMNRTNRKKEGERLG